MMEVKRILKRVGMFFAKDEQGRDVATEDEQVRDAGIEDDNDQCIPEQEGESSFNDDYESA
ncbi:Gag-pol fusion protein [Sesbania bispinosa]|nr:Gag-pol fusion protein [Sesbania bispinosa]